MSFSKMSISIGILALGLSADDLSRGDSSFLKSAAEGGMDEVRLGELATQKASNPEVKEFGRRMMNDHNRMNEEVKALAAKKNVSLPTDIGIKDKASYKILSSKAAPDFDRSYISGMVKDHQQDIAEFEKEVNSGTDADVKALASQALPTIREHLQMAQKIAATLGIQ